MVVIAVPSRRWVGRPPGKRRADPIYTPIWEDPERFMMLAYVAGQLVGFLFLGLMIAAVIGGVIWAIRVMRSPRPPRDNIDDDYEDDEFDDFDDE